MQNVLPIDYSRENISYRLIYLSVFFFIVIIIIRQLLSFVDITRSKHVTIRHLENEQ